MQTSVGEQSRVTLSKLDGGPGEDNLSWVLKNSMALSSGGKKSFRGNSTYQVQESGEGAPLACTFLEVSKWVKLWDESK